MSSNVATGASHRPVTEYVPQPPTLLPSLWNSFPVCSFAPPRRHRADSLAAPLHADRISSPRGPPRQHRTDSLAAPSMVTELAPRVAPLASTEQIPWPPPSTVTEWVPGSLGRWLWPQWVLLGALYAGPVPVLVRGPLRRRPPARLRHQTRHWRHRLLPGGKRWRHGGERWRHGGKRWRHGGKRWRGDQPAEHVSGVRVGTR